MTIGIIFGGRLGYIVFYEPHVIWSKPLEILKTWQGGATVHARRRGT
jgi:phosphatidylglycerol:prolipoprotein diacylglycerol transferase